MNISTVLAWKREKNAKIKAKYWLLQKYKSLWLIMLNNTSVLQELLDGLQYLPGAFIVYIQWEWIQKKWNVIITWELDTSLKWGYDFIVCCDEVTQLQSYLELWVTPIICKNNHMGSIFTEFNAIRTEWNSYLYQELNSYSIYAAIVRYLENYKFSFDNKNLIKNILSI